MALTRLGRLLNALPMKKELKSSLNLPATEQVEAAKTLDDIPAGPTAEELIAALRTYFEIDPSWSDADARALIGVLYETNLRTYSINQQAYIFAQDVNIDVISAVKERRLTGVTIETTTVRQYNTVAAAHLLGHVGDIQSSNWDYYREQGYSMNDKVGIDGAENAFEEYLRGESGVQIQELSTSGKVVSEYWRIDPETRRGANPQAGGQRSAHSGPPPPGEGGGDSGQHHRDSGVGGYRGRRGGGGERQDGEIRDHGLLSHLRLVQDLQ